MYSVSEFKDFVVNHLPDYFPYDWQDAHVKVIPNVQRGNETLTGISVRFDRDEGKGHTCSPVVYLEYAFKHYQEKMKTSSDDCALEIVKDLARSLEDGVWKANAAGSSVSVANGLPPILTENWEKHATVRAVSVSRAEEIHTTPVKVVGDIAFVPCIRAVDEDEQSEMWCVMQDALFETKQLSYSRDDLVQAINRNHSRLAEVEFLTMVQTIARMLHVDEDVVKAMSGASGNEPDIYVLSYKNNGKYGAGLLYDEALLTQVSDNRPDLKDGFFVLPSSIHETVLVPLSQGDPEYLARMQKNIQDTDLQEADRLSDSIYCYTRDTGLVPAHVLYENLGMC